MDERGAPPIRKRMRRWEAEGSVRFVTFSCQRRLPLLGRPAIRDVFVAELDFARQAHEFELFAWVVMPEHVHLLIRPRAEARLDTALRSIKTAVAKRVVMRWRELRAPILDRIATGGKAGAVRFWQKGGGFDRNVRSTEEFCREVQYVHRNPVSRGLVDRPEEWSWSSVRWWGGGRDGEIQCDPPPGDARAWERWTGYR